MFPRFPTYIKLKLKALTQSMLSSLYSYVCPKRNSSGPKLDLQGVSWGQKFHTTQNSCDMPKVPQMLTKSLNNWSYSWAGFTHNTFKCCCLEWDEMEWQILGFNHVCFKKVHSNYPPIWFPMCVEEGIRESLCRFSKSAFPIHLPRN